MPPLGAHSMRVYVQSNNPAISLTNGDAFCAASCAHQACTYHADLVAHAHMYIGKYALKPPLYRSPRTRAHAYAFQADFNPPPIDRYLRHAYRPPTLNHSIFMCATRM